MQTLEDARLPARHRVFFIAGGVVITFTAPLVVARGLEGMSAAIRGPAIVLVLTFAAAVLVAGVVAQRRSEARPQRPTKRTSAVLVGAAVGTGMIVSSLLRSSGSPVFYLFVGALIAGGCPAMVYSHARQWRIERRSSNPPEPGS